MKILTRDNVAEGSNGDMLQGLALVSNVESATTKNGKIYYRGTLNIKGSVEFKAWGGTSASVKFANADYKGVVINLTSAEVNEYQGMKSIVISDFKEVEEEDLANQNLTDGDFFEEKYNTNDLYLNLEKTIQSKCSEKAFQIFKLIMEDGLVKDRFTKEFAAKGVHDNVRGGLIAHTFKTLRVVNSVTIYGNIMKRTDVDLLFLGTVFHDIGKIIEYSDGAISDNGKILSHNISGVLLLTKYQKEISELKNDEFFNKLIAVISQHHGEFGDRPRVVESYIIHLADVFESRVESLDEMLAMQKDDSAVRMDGFQLH